MNETKNILYSIREITAREILRQHAAHYPKMQPTDAVKLLYQSAFGPGHMIADEQSALLRTEAEINSLKNLLQTADFVSPIYEDIGGGYARLYLTPQSTNAAELITKLFVRSANSAEISENKRQKFLDSLEILRELTDEGIFSFSTNELNKYLTEYAANGYPAVSQSDEYRAAYRPAYRVVKREFAIFFSIFSEIFAISQEKGHAVLAIDGFCASGKSTLADIFSNALGTRVIHMDDFFLPPEKRTPERLSEAGGNVDYERFKAEVVDHLADNSLTYGVFDCGELSITSRRILPKTPVTIVEGSYSRHPYFRNYADLSIFLEAPKDEQLERIRLRDGDEMLENFRNRWIPMEQKYVYAYNIADDCDWRITVTSEQISSDLPT